MPPRRKATTPPRRASATSISETGQQLAATVGASATRAWQSNAPMCNAFLGIAAVVAGLAVGMRFLLNPAYPVPPKGVVLVTGEYGGRRWGERAGMESNKMAGFVVSFLLLCCWMTPCGTLTYHFTGKKPGITQQAHPLYSPLAI